MIATTARRRRPVNISLILSPSLLLSLSSPLSLFSALLSEGMQQKLIKEMQDQGADPNTAAGNPILIISGVIAVAVIAIFIQGGVF